MKISSKHGLLFVLGLPFLASCDRDAKLAARFSQVESQSKAAARSNEKILNRLEQVEATLAKVAEDLNATAARHEKDGAGQAALNEGLTKELQEVGQLLKVLAQNSLANQHTVEQKFAKLSQELTTQKEVPLVPQARWALVDKSRVQRETTDFFPAPPLPVDQDPSKNPELAKQVVEYEGLQRKVMTINMSQHGYPFGPGMPGRPGVQEAPEKTSAEDIAAMDKRLAELRITLSGYLARQQQGTKLRDAAVDAAIRELAKNHYDLLIDKAYGDRSLYSRADMPVPDVTDQIIDVIRNARPKP